MEKVKTPGGKCQGCGGCGIVSGAGQAEFTGNAPLPRDHRSAFKNMHDAVFYIY